MRTIGPNARRCFGGEPWFRSNARRRFSGEPWFRALLGLLSISPLVLVPLVASCVPHRGTIGAVIAQDDQSGRLFVREVPPGLAAARADLKPGDEILLIDGLDVRAMAPGQIHAALVGDVDSAVRLTLVRDEQVLRVTLKRTEAQRLLGHPSKAAQTAH